MENRIWIVSIISSIFNIYKESALQNIYIFFTHFAKLVIQKKKKYNSFYASNKRKMKIQSSEPSCRSRNKFSKVLKFIFSRKRIRIVHIHTFVRTISQKFISKLLRNSFVPLCYSQNWFTPGKLSWTCNGTAGDRIEDSHFPRSWDTYEDLYILCSNEERTTMGKRSVIMIAMMDR